MTVAALAVADLWLGAALASCRGVTTLQRAVIMALARCGAWSRRSGVSARTG